MCGRRRDRRLTKPRGGAGHVHAFKRGLVGLQAARADDQIRIQPQGIAGSEFRMQCTCFVKGERSHGPGLEAEVSAFRGDGVAEVAVMDDNAFVEGLLHLLGGARMASAAQGRRRVRRRH